MQARVPLSLIDRNVNDESPFRVYPVLMTIRHIMMPHFKCPAVLLATFLAALLTGCDRTESPQSVGATSSSELKAVVSTERGQFTILLRPDLAPVAVANFVNLAEKGFYHGAEVANANAASFSVGNKKYRTANYTILPEFTTELLFDRPGIVAWTLMDDPVMVENFIPHPTRFFITKTAQPPWNLKYTSFGEIVEGLDTVQATTKGDWIKSIRIVGDSKAALAPHAQQIETWNAAIEDVVSAAKDRGTKGVPLPDGATPAGF